ncbi:hypothetical protein [Streptomyces aureoversilis]|uniref:Uncharacterized protein n=1 Tax=Streptomyces aureoversilis TaxID=67277 RepID=A0ABW0A8E0_9ACTN
MHDEWFSGGLPVNVYRSLSAVFIVSLLAPVSALSVPAHASQKRAVASTSVDCLRKVNDQGKEDPNGRYLNTYRDATGKKKVVLPNYDYNFPGLGPLYGGFLKNDTGRPLNVLAYTPKKVKLAKLTLSSVEFIASLGGGQAEQVKNIAKSLKHFASAKNLDDFAGALTDAWELAKFTDGTKGISEQAIDAAQALADGLEDGMLEIPAHCLAGMKKKDESYTVWGFSDLLSPYGVAWKALGSTYNINATQCFKRKAKERNQKRGVCLEWRELKAVVKDKYSLWLDEAGLSDMGTKVEKQSHSDYNPVILDVVKGSSIKNWKYGGKLKVEEGKKVEEDKMVCNPPLKSFRTGVQ